jgi:hypothetical protein
VPEGYVPSKLVGEWGIRVAAASAPIPPGTPLGVYEGVMYQSSRPNWFPPTSDLALRIGLKSRFEEWDVEPYPPYCNAMMERTNDFRIDVTRADDTTVNDRSRINCSWSPVMFQGQPFPMFITTTTINPGEWVLIDYGLGYWKARVPQVIHKVINPTTTLPTPSTQQSTPLPTPAVTSTAPANPQATLNPQAPSVVNAQAPPIVNAQGASIVNAQASPVVNAQATPVVSAQSTPVIPVVNAQANPIVNAQAISVVHPQSNPVVDAQSSAAGVISEGGVGKAPHPTNVAAQNAPTANAAAQSCPPSTTTSVILA